MSFLGARGQMQGVAPRQHHGAEEVIVIPFVQTRRLLGGPNSGAIITSASNIGAVSFMFGTLVPASMTASGKPRPSKSAVLRSPRAAIRGVSSGHGAAERALDHHSIQALPLSVDAHHFVDSSWPRRP